MYWSMWESTEAQGQVIQKAIDQFVADTGHTVDVQFKGRTGQREGLQPALDAGTVIDLFDEAHSTGQHHLDRLPGGPGGGWPRPRTTRPPPTRG